MDSLDRRDVDFPRTDGQKVKLVIHIRARNNFCVKRKISHNGTLSP
jgi:hypothetical protein